MMKSNLGRSPPKWTKPMQILAILTLILLSTNCKKLDEHMCMHMVPKNNPIISVQLYKDLIGGMKWDLGQHTLKSDLTQTHNDVLSCLFLDGFRNSNLQACLGPQFEGVIAKYEEKANIMRHKFVQAIMDHLEFEGYDNMAPIEFENLSKDLLFALEANQPVLPSLKAFENDIAGSVPSDMSEMSHVFAIADEHYLIYLSLKRMMKAYSILTVKCFVQVVQMNHIELQPDNGLENFPEEEIDKFFPDSEIEKQYNDKESLHEKLINAINKETNTFNEDMMKQAKLKNLLAAQLASGKLDAMDIDPEMTPEEIFRAIVTDQSKADALKI